MKPPRTPAPTNRNGVQVIARAASILRAFENEPAGLSIGELAARLDLARSTVQRIVGALIDEGLMINAAARAGVTLGPALTWLAAGTINVERLVRPVLRELSRAIGEIVDLSMLQGVRAVFVDQVVGTSRLVAISAIGESFLLHCTANGKALLSRLRAEQRDRTLGIGLERYTANIITDRAALERQLDEIAGPGITWDQEEHAEGICIIGTSFIDPLRRDVGLSVSVPASRFAAKQDDIRKALLRSCSQIMVAAPGASSKRLAGNNRKPNKRSRSLFHGGPQNSQSMNGEDSGR